VEAKPYASAVARESGGAWDYEMVKRVAHRAGIDLTAGRSRHRLPDDEEAAIKRALEAKPHASAVARESGCRWSYATVWRVAHREDIDLTAGREAQSKYHRLPDERRAAVIEARRANPDGSQEDIARAAMNSRLSIIAEVSAR
jgi:hypothetical protein